MTTSISGIILAAGRSERMGGRPKALLELTDRKHGPETFVARAVRVLREAGIATIVVVTNPSTEEPIRAACPEGIRVVVNPRPEDGMVSSIRRALEAGADADRVVVTLVDIPEITATVVRALADHEPRTGAWMAFPVFSDGRGHPLLLYRESFSALNRDLPRGLKSLVECAPQCIEDIPVAGAQPWDVDTPEDYRRYTP